VTYTKSTQSTNKDRRNVSEDLLVGSSVNSQCLANNDGALSLALVVNTNHLGFVDEVAFERDGMRQHLSLLFTVQDHGRVELGTREGYEIFLDKEHDELNERARREIWMHLYKMSAMELILTCHGATTEGDNIVAISLEGEASGVSRNGLEVRI
jgi:hypothetical protein